MLECFFINLELASLWPGDWILLTIHHLWDAHSAGAGEGRKLLMFPRGSMFKKPNVEFTLRKREDFCKE
jgi:hypothetical protein